MTDPLLAAGGTQTGKVDGRKVSKSGTVCSVASAGRIGNGTVALQYDIHKQHNGIQGAVCDAIGWGLEAWGMSRAYYVSAGAGAGNHSPCSAPS